MCVKCLEQRGAHSNCSTRGSGQHHYHGGSKKPESGACIQLPQRARDAFLNWEVKRLEVDFKVMSLAR